MKRRFFAVQTQQQQHPHLDHVWCARCSLSAAAAATANGPNYTGCLFKGTRWQKRISYTREKDGSSKYKGAKCEYVTTKQRRQFNETTNHRHRHRVVVHTTIRMRNETRAPVLMLFVRSYWERRCWTANEIAVPLFVLVYSSVSQPLFIRHRGNFNFFHLFFFFNII